MAKKKSDEDYGLEDVIKGISGIRRELKQIRQGLLAENKMAYTNQDVMDMFDVGTKTLKKWRDSGELSFTLKGSIYLYSKKDITDFLNRNHYKIFDDSRSLKDVVNDIRGTDGAHVKAPSVFL